MAAETWS